MKNLLSHFLRVLVILVVMTSWAKYKDSNILVKNSIEFNKAVAEAKPGDIIVMANGVWKDSELVFEGKGTKEQPITLTVEDPGKVTLEGASNLQIAGDYLIVKGLVFKNGYTTTNEVISFRKNKKELAHV